MPAAFKLLMSSPVSLYELNNENNSYVSKYAINDKHGPACREMPKSYERTYQPIFSKQGYNYVYKNYLPYIANHSRWKTFAVCRIKL